MGLPPLVGRGAPLGLAGIEPAPEPTLAQSARPGWPVIDSLATELEDLVGSAVYVELRRRLTDS